jgi:hypothetical protein
LEVLQAEDVRGKAGTKDEGLGLGYVRLGWVRVNVSLSFEDNFSRERNCSTLTAAKSVFYRGLNSKCNLKTARDRT